MNVGSQEMKKNKGDTLSNGLVTEWNTDQWSHSVPSDQRKTLDSVVRQSLQQAIQLLLPEEKATRAANQWKRVKEKERLAGRTVDSC